ncbi:DNA repair protein RecN [Clostridium perfringens]|uniref:DNA repair protein RecN n=1 Tax=Clostridium perfringens TaxID=1502 RepID=UPI00232BF2AE|nr:DNA repair protein RecN [Clostridium perfringens]MDB2060432.1 DNA repair protein RecN [Clostridium perfringens]MDB2063555.1 DNA repair protein RecN [Clostridium perfringens]MDB2066163.1 DNA repair protein RecN [Clostridium perfringens]
MLLQLTINNFALIEKASLDFKEGFTILSGETGAGKSILIDAINYVQGSKFNKDLIRTGEEKTFVEAIFSIDDNERLKEILDDLEIDYDDTLIISRETFINGRSNIKVNGRSIIVATLKKISSTLLDIHGQHNNQNLLNKENHIMYLDDFGDSKLSEDLKEYGEKFSELKDIERKISELSNEGKDEKLLNYLEYQLNEIEEAKLRNGEEEELTERFNVLSNAEKIKNSLGISYNLLNGIESSVVDSLSLVNRELSNVEEHLEKIKNINSKIMEMYYEIQEMAREIRDICDESVYDGNELEEINSRMFKIASLKKKYGNSIAEILEYKNNILSQINNIKNSEKIIEDLLNEKSKVENVLSEIANRIHNKRIELSKVLEENIHKELAYVGLGKCRFEVLIEEDETFNFKGKDKVQFLISTNPGEPLKPMERIVSGGELSRIMLALKAVFIDKDKIPTVIFDEIDTGISGRVAQSVGEKMYEISTKHQVFCITHLPQIASMSDNHYMVRKKVIDNKTFSKVEPITYNQKIEEVGKMLGGVEMTSNTLLNAKEMIELADTKKETIKTFHT